MKNKNELMQQSSLIVNAENNVCDDVENVIVNNGIALTDIARDDMLLSVLSSLLAFKYVDDKDNQNQLIVQHAINVLLTSKQTNMSYHDLIIYSLRDYHKQTNE